MADNTAQNDNINSNLLSLVKNVGLLLQTIQTTFPGQFVPAPATATSPGTTNQVAYDATHFYICIGPSRWVRATLATF